MIKISPPIILKSIASYLLSLFIAILFVPLFSEFYGQIFNPPIIGYGILGNVNEELMFSGFLFSYMFILPLVVNILVSKKMWLVWLVGILPFIIFIRGLKEVLWFVIFTVLGALLGWLIKFLYKKFKK